MKKGFDSNKYVKEQTEYILERVRNSEGRLYIECGGKLLHDTHASRVLPGFDEDNKMKVFKALKEHLDIIICIYAGDIEKRKVRSDFGISYEADVLRMIDDFSANNLNADKVVITRYDDQPTAKIFMERLKRRGVKVYTHRATPDYPNNLDLVVSDEGYGANPWIEVSAPVVVVTAPGPGSGKLATSLNQMYHEAKRGERPSYSKLETFPIWNLPLEHPVNIAYEAATIDLDDINMIDHFHLEAYGKLAVNYNRDIEAFPILSKLLEKITGTTAGYKSPTDMGVNRAGFGITDDEICREAGRQEIIRRYYKELVDYTVGLSSEDDIKKAIGLMDRAKTRPEDRRVVSYAEEALEKAIIEGKGKDGVACAASIELPDGAFVTSHNSDFLHAASALLLNGIKRLAGISPKRDLIHPNVIDAITKVKKDVLHGKGISLNLDETIIALAMSSAVDNDARSAVAMLPELRGCQVHLTHIPSAGDATGLRKLGLIYTSDPKYPSRNDI